MKNQKTTPAASIHEWMAHVQRNFSFYEGFFLLRLWEGELLLWPPSLKYYGCDQSLTDKNNIFSCSVGDASFFRIPCRTHMPYHGYVVPSPVHDRLYAALKTNVPQHVTILPLMEPDNTTLGALLYMDTKTVADVSQIPTIQKVEWMWEELSAQFSKLYTLSRGQVIPMTK